MTTGIVLPRKDSGGGCSNLWRTARTLGWMVTTLLTFGEITTVAAAAHAFYTNPIGSSITMGDPFILVDGHRFILYGTTAVNEGFKCWTTTNLVDWSERGFAYRKSTTSWAGNTFWAPEVIHYRDRYYMVFSAQPSTNRSFSTRICLAASDRPEGPFHDSHAPLFDNGWSCIDGHIFVDNDGTPYLYFDKVGVTNSSSRRYLSGLVYGVRLKSDLSGIDGKPVLCVQADQPWELPENGRSRCNEGSFVFRHAETYYMTYSANHYAEPFYGIGYATAPSPLGPWKKSAANPLVSQKPELGISGPGHNCVIKSPDGTELFVVYHTHADPAKPGGGRVVNLDRLIVRADGGLQFAGPTRSPQPLPSGL